MAATILSVALAGLLAVVVPAGQPYDEPSHWDTVQFYAEEHRLPRLGEPGVTYEAQMGPVAYTVGGLETAVLGEERGFTVFRWTNALLCGLIVPLTFLLARQLYPERPWFGVWAAAFTGVLPTIVAFSGSVQNDTLAVVFSLGAAVAAIRVLDGRSEASLRWWFATGALTSFAVLSKIQAAALVPALLVAVVALPGARRRESMKGAFLATATVVAGTGWWFVRNLVLYGDLTAVDSISETGVAASARPLDLSNVAGLARATVSVVWAPTEYYRNAFEAPLLLRGLTVVATGLVLVAAVIALLHGLRSARSARLSIRTAVETWRTRPERVFLVAWILLTVISWLVLVFASSNVSPRVLAVVAAPSVVLLGAAVAGVLRRAGGRRLASGVGLALIGFVVVVDLWLATEVTKIAPQPFWIQGV